MTRILRKEMASQLIEEVTAHAQSDSLEDARGICAYGTYFPNNLRILLRCNVHTTSKLIVNLMTTSPGRNMLFY